MNTSHLVVNRLLINFHSFELYLPCAAPFSAACLSNSFSSFLIIFFVHDDFYINCTPSVGKECTFLFSLLIFFSRNRIDTVYFVRTVFKNVVNVLQDSRRRIGKSRRFRKSQHDFNFGIVEGEKA